MRRDLYQTRETNAAIVVLTTGRPINLNGARLLHAANDRVAGINLQMDGEYELAWIIFNDEEEVVGFVYDGMYSALQIEDAETFIYVNGVKSDWRPDWLANDH